MRILLIASFSDSLVNFRGPLIAALQDRGLEVHVITPDLTSESSALRQLQSRGVIVHTVPMQRTGTNPFRDLLTFVALQRKTSRICPDVLLAYTIKPVIYGTLAAWLAGVPRRFALITGLGYVFTGEARGIRALVKTFVRGLYGLALKHTYKVFFQNPDDQALFASLGLIPDHVPSVVVNGSGVDLSHYAPTRLPSGSLRFLLIARLLGDKGVREYAAAAQQLRLKFPEVRCSLVGWIDENPDAISKTELDDWVARGSIEYLGRMCDVRSAIADCTVYVLPSYREGTPRTVLEAMAMGRAIVTTDAPGCRETVVHGDNGFLVPPRSVDALVMAMERFVLDPSLAARMGRSSRRRAEEKYDVNKVNAMMLEQMEIR